jgi:hypothetical protein
MLTNAPAPLPAFVSKAKLCDFLPWKDKMVLMKCIPFLAISTPCRTSVRLFDRDLRSLCVFDSHACMLLMTGAVSSALGADLSPERTKLL